MATKDNELTDEEIIGEFSRIAQEHILRKYEEKNRDKINGASLTVRDTFDKVWKKVCGQNYYQPTTTIQPQVPTFGQNNVERSDPRSQQYRANVIFSLVKWAKVMPRRKIGKRFLDMWNLMGIEKDTGDERPIFQNLDASRLKQVLSEKLADEIKVKSKTEDFGEIKGPITLRVEGYWEVIFSPAKSENDPIDVPLHWEGVTLLIKRMKPVVLPGFYIEIADHATRDHYTVTPKEGRKRIGEIQEFPYTTLRPASRQEYLEMKNAGDRIMRNVRERAA